MIKVFLKTSLLIFGWRVGKSNPDFRPAVSGLSLQQHLLVQVKVGPHRLPDFSALFSAQLQSFNQMHGISENVNNLCSSAVRALEKLFACLHQTNPNFGNRKKGFFPFTAHENTDHYYFGNRHFLPFAILIFWNVTKMAFEQFPYIMQKCKDAFLQ